MDDDDGDDDNDNGGIDDSAGVGINDDNDANGGDSVSKTDRDDDADVGDGDSNDDGGINGNGVFGKWCIDGKGGDEADDGNEQTESVAGDHAGSDGSSKIEMRPGVMR